ncbi:MULTISPECIES: imm11 family protein [unclassified Ruegeria]|nr:MULTISPECIES: DUF1629 domain-containing protein [unclassified Ruegeria]NOD33991.1 hypothetical protein [Ruegeria sp. HKCCD7296]NOD46372.1 hypothetical protein [Ruegeria sp. HKCCD5849]NOD50328.1 hypothetical protein [Ruegeria sp. HKCCD5851]NOD67144.1 hypothetical protein [Ruegeria sp. HKCCD7303]NOE32733.1 hypothetical protein [Ruegeria sp. HKCCD7318]
MNRSGVIQSILRKEFGLSWREKRSADHVEWSKRMVQESALGWKRGDILTKEQVGEVWYFNSKAEYYTAPFISGGGYPLVSEFTKAVLEQFDLGNTVFHPLKLMDSTESHLTTSEPYYFLNVGNKRSMGNYDALGPEGDIRSPLDNIGNGIRYLPRSSRESELVVVPEAMDGPDIWVDPLVPKLLFLSDHLVAGLKAAGVDKGWGLVRCRVGTL